MAASIITGALAFTANTDSGMRSAERRGSPAEVITAMSCKSQRLSSSGPSSAIRLRMTGARSAVIH